MSSPPLSCSPCSTPHSWLPSPRSHSQFYVISTSELSTLLDATVMAPQSPQTKLCRLNTTFTEVHRVEVAETLSEINQSLTRHSSQYGIANILFCNHADNPTLEVLAAIPLSLFNTSLELSTFDCNCHLSWLKITNTPLAAHGPLANTNHCHQRALQQRRGAGGASWSPDIFILQHSESTGCSTCQE